MTDEQTRSAAEVVRVALAGGVAEWNPGDMTKYRVLLWDDYLEVSVGDQKALVPPTNPPPTAEVWRASGLNPMTGYDWWPRVIAPLVQALRAQAAT